MDPKVYVGVLVEVSAAGDIRPIQVVWEDGRRFNVDRVLDCRRAASLKAGGQGTRFTCRIHGKTTYLFNEEGRWFMERKGGREHPKLYPTHDDGHKSASMTIPGESFIYASFHDCVGQA